MKTNLQVLAPWKFNMGIELTFVTAKYPNRPKDDKWGDETQDGYYQHIKWGVYEARMDRALRESGQMGSLDYETPNAGDVIGCWNDPGCVETPTRILCSWDDAKQVWHRVVDTAKSVGLVPFEEHQETGMGHIHTTLTKEQSRIIQMDLIHRPYLAWTLASPSQSGSNDSFAHTYCVQIRKEGHHLGSRLCTDKDCMVTFRNESDTCGEYDGQGNYKEERGGHDHMEFRAFDAACDWEMQEEHIALLQRYYAWILKNPRPWPKRVKVMDRDYASDITYRYSRDKDKCIKEYRAFIKTLGLPADRYDWYIERNLIPAFDWGYRR